MNKNLSAAFVARALKINYSGKLFGEDHINTYLGYQTEDAYGKYFYFLFKDPMREDLREHLTLHPLFLEQFVPNDGEIMFKFRVPDDVYEQVVHPFIRGKYSEIDRTYVEENFPRDPLSPTFVNRRILDKDDGLRRYWEDKIGCSLPQNAEV